VGFFSVKEIELAKNKLFDIAKEACTSLDSGSVIEPMQRPQRGRVISGVCVEAIPKRLMAFANRLHNETTVEELSKFPVHGGLHG